MKEQIEQVCTHAQHSIQINYTHARISLRSRSESEHIQWWSDQITKWEILWGNFQDLTADLDNEKQLMHLDALSDAAFSEYENLFRQTMALKIMVPLKILKDEAKKWRETGVRLSMLHKCGIFRALA